MKQLSDADLVEMIGGEFIADDKHTKNQVRRELRLSTRIPEPAAPAPKHTVLDLHQMTEEQAWQSVSELIHSGTRTAVVITGASGILNPKFQEWMTNSILAPHVISCTVRNNGSFDIRIRRK